MVSGAPSSAGWGRRTLGTIVPAPEEYPRVQQRVLELRTGVEVLDPSQFTATQSGKKAMQPASGGTDGATRMADTPASPVPGTATASLAGNCQIAATSISDPDTLPAAFVPVGDSLSTAIAMEFLSSVAGGVRLLAADLPRACIEQGIWADGYMFDRGAESAVEPGPPSFIGAEPRRRAAELHIQKLLAQAEELEAQAERQRQQAERYESIAATCLRCRDELEQNAPQPLFLQAHLAHRATAAATEAAALAEECKERVERARSKVETVRHRHDELLALIDKRGLIDLRQRMEDMERQLDATRNRQGILIKETGACQERVKEKERQLAEAQAELERKEAQRQQRREELAALIPPDAGMALEDHFARILQLNRAQLENIPRYIQEANTNRVRALENIKSSDGIYNQRVWQKFGFRLHEDRHEILDQSGSPIETVFAERETEVNGLTESLNEKNRDLMERVIMAGLVKRLQLQLRELRSVISGINALSSDLWFGHSRFNFSYRARPDFARLINLLNEQSILQDGRREELRDFFMARIDTFKQSRDGEIPDILDYRCWYEFKLETRRGEGQRAELANDKLSFGSTGEQAVPRYLLIIALASLFYDRCAAKLRVLLMDEAFLGIDEGRREGLLQFADRCKVSLVVATPELDGVTPSLAESTTLLIEKNLEGDVFVSDFHWTRQEQLGLFAPGEVTAEQEYVIGQIVQPVEDVSHPGPDTADIATE